MVSNELPPRVDPILHRAAELLRDEGWIQKTGYIPEAGRCLTRALWCVSEKQDQPLRGLHRSLLKLGFRDLSQAIAWNDTKERTKEEVINRLEDAAFGREVK